MNRIPILGLRRIPIGRLEDIKMKIGGLVDSISEVAVDRNVPSVYAPLSPSRILLGDSHLQHISLRRKLTSSLLNACSATLLGHSA